MPAAPMHTLNSNPHAQTVDEIKKDMADSFISDIPKSDILPVGLPRTRNIAGAFGSCILTGM